MTSNGQICCYYYCCKKFNKPLIGQCHKSGAKTRPYQPNDWLLQLLPPVVNTSNECTICHTNYPPVLLLRFQISVQGQFLFGPLSENALSPLPLVQKAVGAVRTLTPTSSPLSSPSKHGDRFIPSRAGANWSVNFHRINVSLLQNTQAFHYLSYQKHNTFRMFCMANKQTHLFSLFFLVVDMLSVCNSLLYALCVDIWCVYWFHFLTQEIEKSHNQNRKTKDGTTDSNKGN